MGLPDCQICQINEPIFLIHTAFWLIVKNMQQVDGYWPLIQIMQHSFSVVQCTQQPQMRYVGGVLLRTQYFNLFRLIVANYLCFDQWHSILISCAQSHLE